MMKAVSIATALICAAMPIAALGYIAKAAVDTSLPSLAETYKDHFLIGNVISPWDLGDSERMAHIKHHYNVLTAENAMKPDAMLGRGGEYTFESVDSMLDVLIPDGFSIVGHTLAWHNQSRDFLNKDSSGKALTRKEAEKNLKDFIDNVAGHYKGKILSWDVLNEAIADGASTDWKEALRRNDWFSAFDNGGDGTEYVEFAFRAAREADPNAILYYNDYNLDVQNKAAAVAAMISEINERYLAEGGDRLLIEGVGMQGHYTTQTKIQNVERSIKLFIETGVEISITELDIGVPSGANAISQEYERGQALKYAELFSMLKTYSGHIARVTFWGTDDAHSWRGNSFPQLFHGDLSPKMAYWAVLDPEGFLADYSDGFDIGQSSADLERRGVAAYGTPVLNAETLDPLWENTETLPIDKMLQAWETASGTARVLWDESNLYVLFEVRDTVLDSSSSTVYAVDSVEAFVDYKNCKAGVYADCDGQYRVSYQNAQSFGSSTESSGFESDAFIGGAGYRVVMKIPSDGTGLEANTIIGFDAQINDAKDSARVGIAKWNDASDDSWQDTSNWGTLELVTQFADPADSPPEADGSSDGSGEAPASTAPDPATSAMDEDSENLFWYIAAGFVTAAVGIVIGVIHARKKKTKKP